MKNKMYFHALDRVGHSDNTTQIRLQTKKELSTRTYEPALTNPHDNTTCA